MTRFSKINCGLVTADGGGSRFLASFVLALSFAGGAHASSIVLVSVDPGPIQQFHYALRLAPGEFNSFGQGAELNLTGMSALTGTSMSGLLAGCFDVNFSDTTSARLIQLDAVGCGINNPLITSADFPEWTIRSSSQSIGPVNYTVEALSGPFSGQVLGPVAESAVPEPSTAALALFALAALRWRLLGRRTS